MKPIERILEATCVDCTPGYAFVDDKVAMEIAEELETALEKIKELENEISLLKK